MSLIKGNNAIHDPYIYLCGRFLSLKKQVMIFDAHNGILWDFRA